jgi:hypothetical protein
MTKHTPGPWLFRGKSSSVHEQPKNEPGEKCTYGKQIFRFRDDDDEVAGISDEDLALILAAPEMLAALEKCVAALEAMNIWDLTRLNEQEGKVLLEACAVVAKAKGEKP